MLPGGTHLALYLAGARKNSVATFDVVAHELAASVELPRDLEPGCRRTHHDYAEREATFTPASGLFYVAFSCDPDA